MQMIFPIGGCLFLLNDSDPNTMYEGTTWELVGQDRCIQGASTTHPANSTVEAGLPNITGDANRAYFNSALSYSGALYVDTRQGGGSLSGSGSTGQNNIHFDASRSNDIYGASDTVQPPALCMNIWKRTA